MRMSSPLASVHHVPSHLLGKRQPPTNSDYTGLMSKLRNSHSRCRSATSHNPPWPLKNPSVSRTIANPPHFSFPKKPICGARHVFRWTGIATWSLRDSQREQKKINHVLIDLRVNVFSNRILTFAVHFITKKQRYKNIIRKKNESNNWACDLIYHFYFIKTKTDYNRPSKLSPIMRRNIGLRKQCWLDRTHKTANQLQIPCVL